MVNESQAPVRAIVLGKVCTLYSIGKEGVGVYHQHDINLTVNSYFLKVILKNNSQIFWPPEWQIKSKMLHNCLRGVA